MNADNESETKRNKDEEIRNEEGGERGREREGEKGRGACPVACKHSETVDIFRSLGEHTINKGALSAYLSQGATPKSTLITA